MTLPVNEDKLKVIYDNRHGYYRLAPTLEIPEKYMNDIRVQDLFHEYDILYNGISIDNIERYIGIYHMTGKDGLENTTYHNRPLTREMIENIIEVYNKPKEELWEAIHIIDELKEYPTFMIREHYPEIMIN